MKRRIIHIDEEKCNGCGACAAACHEDAIAMVNGKAKLMRDDYCDGLGDCLPACPTGAITFVEREAAAYNAEAVKENLMKIRTGRAHTGLLEHITVDYYGCPTPVNQMASVSVSEARVLQIQPYDASSLKAIEKAIQVSDIGINPQNDGRVIRLVFPPLTEERRKELVKEVKKLAEDGKVAIRSIRRDAIEKLKALKKNSEITEDEQADGEKKIQNYTDKYCKEIDDITSAKEKEIMEI